MRGKLISAILVMAVVITSIKIPILADVISSEADVDILAEKNATFRISIPDGLNTDIDENGYGNKDYEIGVTAELASDEHLLVTPQDAYTQADGDKTDNINFLLQSAGKVPIVADIRQNSTEVTCGDTLNGVKKTLYGSISTEDKITAGTWSGKFNFKVEFGKKYEELILSSDNYSCIGYTDETTDLIIPETTQIDGVTYVITGIAAATFLGKINITSVTMSDAIKTIGPAAFNSCSGLKKITTSRNTETIGNGAFAVSGLETADIYAKNIEGNIFVQCGNLKNIRLYNFETMQDGAIGGLSSLESVEAYGNNAVIGNSFCSYCPNLANVSIGGIKSFGSGALIETAIKEIRLDDKLESLGAAFCYNCANLDTVDFGNECNITTVQGSVFGKTPWLTAQLEQNDMVTTPSGCIIALNTNVENLVISASVTSIPDSLFYNNTSLKTVTFEDESQCKSIGRGAFGNCTSLTSIILPDSITSISEDAFQYCDAVTHIELPANLETIGNYAFNHLGSVDNTSLDIPASVNDIGGTYPTHTFYDFGKDETFKAFNVASTNSNYKDIDGVLYTKDGATLISIPRGKTFTNNTYEIPEGTTVLSELSFSRNLNIHKVILPDSYDILESMPTSYGWINKGNSLSIAIYAFTGVKEYEVKSTNTKYKSVNGCIYSKDGTELIAVPPEYEGDLVIPEGVILINKNAFSYKLNDPYVYNDLQSITIPSTMTTIDADMLEMINSRAVASAQTGSWVINNSSSGYSINASGKLIEGSIPAGLVIENNIVVDGSNVSGDIVIPTSVTAIGDSAFSGNTAITSLSFGENSQCTIIGNYAFQNCTNLATINLPTSLKTLSLGSFKYCVALRDIVLPDGMASIGQDSFNMYGTGLTSIVIPTSVSSIGNWAFANCSSLNVYYKGTEAQWNLITMSAGDNEPLVNAPRTYNYSN